MDGASTLVLEGQIDDFPKLNVSGLATLDGELIVRVSVPSNFSAFGTWQSVTVLTCSRQCLGGFRNVTVESVGACISIEEVREVREIENLMTIAVSFDKPPICFSASFLPPLLSFGVIFFFIYVK